MIQDPPVADLQVFERIDLKNKNFENGQLIKNDPEDASREIDLKNYGVITRLLESITNPWKMLEVSNFIKPRQT